jgi:hypothetical protein
VTTTELRRLLSEATPGPWRPCGANNDRCICGIVWGPGSEATIGGPVEDVPHHANPADAALIAAMRNTLPSLLDRLDAAEVVVRQARRLYGEAAVPWDALTAALARYDEVSR